MQLVTALLWYFASYAIFLPSVYAYHIGRSEYLLTQNLSSSLSSYGTCGSGSNLGKGFWNDVHTFRLSLLDVLAFRSVS
jgi:hypothetical protein